MKLALDLVVNFSYNIIECILKWAKMGICHCNTSDISLLALQIIDVDVFGRIHKV